MGLKLKKILATMEDGDYHRLVKWTPNVVDETLDYDIALYKNKAARDVEADRMDTVSKQCALSEVDLTLDLRPQIYVLAQSQPEWENAEDVIE